MVARVHRVRAFERPEVGNIGDDHNDRRIAPHVGTYRARVLRVDVAANAADRDLLERGGERRTERRHDLLALLDQKQRRAPRRTRSQPGQSREQLDQALDLRSGSGGGHQNSFNPGGIGRPPATLFIFSCMSVSTLRRASAWAATRRSSTISFSDGLSRLASIEAPFMSPLPESFTVTSPPPDMPSTSAASSSACAASIFVLSSAACFIRPTKSAIVASMVPAHLVLRRAHCSLQLSPSSRQSIP